MLDETEEEMESLRKQEELVEKDEKENENLVWETLYKQVFKDGNSIDIIMFEFYLVKKLKVDWRNLMNLKLIPKDFYQTKSQQSQAAQQPQQQLIQVWETKKSNLSRDF